MPLSSNQIRIATQKMFKPTPDAWPFFIGGDADSLEALAGGMATPGETPMYWIRFGNRKRNARKRERRARRGK